MKTVDFNSTVFSPCASFSLFSLLSRGWPETFTVSDLGLLLPLVGQAETHLHAVYIGCSGRGHEGHGSRLFFSVAQRLLLVVVVTASTIFIPATEVVGKAFFSKLAVCFASLPFFFPRFQCFHCVRPAPGSFAHSVVFTMLSSFSSSSVAVLRSQCLSVWGEWWNGQRH